ncbi:DYL1 protein, partial [Himantopus himantopus]|nr:DYL1 protein [Himantopus himantopus]
TGDWRALIKDRDVSEVMQCCAVECVVWAIEKYGVEREIAALVERANEFDSPTWHCVAGRKFGSSVSNETKHFIFLMSGVNILLFKAG